MKGMPLPHAMTQTRPESTALSEGRESQQATCLCRHLREVPKKANTDAGSGLAAARGWGGNGG